MAPGSATATREGSRFRHLPIRTTVEPGLWAELPAKAGESSTSGVSEAPEPGSHRHRYDRFEGGASRAHLSRFLAMVCSCMLLVPS